MGQNDAFLSRKLLQLASNDGNGGGWLLGLLGDARAYQLIPVAPVVFVSKGTSGSGLPA